MGKKYFCKDVLPSRMLQQLAVLPNTQRKRVQAAVLKGKEWPQGYVLKIKFLGGTVKLHNWVKNVLDRSIQPHVNLRLTFVDSGSSDIRIGFHPDHGSWSYLGTDAWDIPENEATMNIGWSDDGDGVVLHEFGHALGPWIHEHQNPNNNTIEWNESVVIKALSGPPNNWDIETIRENMLNTYKKDQIRGSDYDSESIMQYFYPGSWTMSGNDVNSNTKLSQTDILWLKKVYPKATTVSTDLGTTTDNTTTTNSTTTTGNTTTTNTTTTSDNTTTTSDNTTTNLDTTENIANETKFEKAPTVVTLASVLYTVSAVFLFFAMIFKVINKKSESMRL